ncbi:Fanconi anemia group D2 protein [Linnemannia zychae]|nr:Fanconi anemia group D2 protein [Linnemannia zychae]
MSFDHRPHPQHLLIPSDESLDQGAIALRLSQFLDKATLLSCVRVSRTWFTALEPCLWHSFTLLRDPPNTTAQHPTQQHQYAKTRRPRCYPTLGSLQRNARYIVRLRYYGELPLLKTLLPHLIQLQYLEATRYSDDVKQLLKQNATTLHTLILKGDALIPGDTILIDRLWFHLLDFTALHTVKLNSAIVSDYEGLKFGLVCQKLTQLSLVDSKFIERPKSEESFHKLKTLVLDRSFIPKGDDPPLFELCPTLEDFTWKSRSGKLSIFKFLVFLNAGRGEALSGLNLSGSHMPDSDLASVIRLLPGLTRFNASSSMFGLDATRAIIEVRQHQIQELVLLQCPGFGPTVAQEVLRTCSRLRVFSAPAVNAVDMAQLRWGCTGLEELDICIAGTRRLPRSNDPRHQSIYSQLALLTKLRVLRLGEVTDMEEGPFLLDLKVKCGLGVLSTLTRLEVLDCEKLKPVMEFFDLQWVILHWKSLRRLVGSVHPNVEQRDLSNEFLRSQLRGLETYSTQADYLLAGLELGQDGAPNVLQVEPSRFQREAARLIQRGGASGGGCVESFLEGLQEHLEDADNLRICLIPIIKFSEKGQQGFSNGESLIRILLSIDVIQPGLMEALLERIFGFLGDEEKESPTPKLILQQMRWLNNIIEPAQLSAKLLEVIGVSSVTIQRDIITSLPEIVPDSEHKTVVLGLFELMESSSELMVPILDALSNLNLQSDMLINARNHVMGKLISAELDDLPIVIKFLLQTVEPENVGEVIETIRQKLDFRSINKLQKSSRTKTKKIAVNQTPEVLILDALKTGIRFQKFVMDAWFKALSAISKAGQYKVIDVMVMFILYSIVSLKKKVEIMIRKKIIEGVLTKKLLEDTILVHGVSLREYMSSVLSISENLLRSSQNHPIVARSASTLYSSAFQVSDAYYRQEIVGSLLVHIGSGSNIEIDASLEVLQDIVQVSRSTLNEYSLFIKGVLDYMDNLSLEQVRLFFVILGSLAREDEISCNSGSLITDLNILIRKQLSNPTVQSKKVGVMGAIALVQAFGVKENGGDEKGSSSQAPVSHRQAEVDPLLKISVQYLHMIKEYCQRSAVCLAMTFDELASMVISGKLDSKLVNWIKEEFSNQFAETFVCGADETFIMKPTRNMAMERWMNLDGPESVLSISIMPSLCADLSKMASQGTLIENADGVVYLCSLFKLLQATEKITSNDGLDDIDGLLGCGITMFKQEYLEDISEVYSQEICHAAAQGLLCAINWFREISNAFSYDAGDQTLARIILRLQQISEMEEMLRHVLKSVPGFKPLEAIHIKSKDMLPRRGLTIGGSPSLSRPLSTLQGKKSIGAMDVDSVSSGKFTTTSSELIDLFQVLRVHHPIVREIFDVSEVSNSNTVQLRYPELRFLLKDLLAKITFKLPAPVAHNPFAKKPTSAAINNSALIRMAASDFMKQVLKIVPHIVTKTRIMLHLLSSEDDDMGQSSESVDHAIVRECLSISLKALLALLSWNELRASDQKALRLDMLKALAVDLASEEQLTEIQNSVNLSAMAHLACNNLAKWREMMPNFETSAMLLEVLDKMLDLVPPNQETMLKASTLATEVLSYSWPSTNNVKSDRLAYVLGQQIGKSDVLYVQLVALVSQFSEEQFDDTDAAFSHISDLSLCFQKLAAFVKSNDKREVLAVTLKHSKIFMDQFIKRALPFMGVHFRGHQDTVAKIFKNHLQAATRSLQNVCGHAKASREQTLTAMVPAIKKTMESLIFEVKLMLENNDASAAFWLGNLKHRNLAGEEISSQLPVISESEDAVDEIESMSEDGEGGTQRKTAAARNPKKRARGTPKKAAKSKSIKAKAMTKDDPSQKGKLAATKKEPTTKRKTAAQRDDEAEARIHTLSQITNSDMSEDEAPVNSEPRQLTEFHEDDAEENGDDGDDDDEGILAARRKSKKPRAIRAESVDLEDDEVDLPMRRKGKKPRAIREQSIDLEDGEDEDEDDDEDGDEDDDDDGDEDGDGDEDEEEEDDEYTDRMLQEQDERAERRRRARNPYIDDYADQNDEEEVYSDDEEEEDSDEDGEVC